VQLPVEQQSEWFKDGLQFECTGCGNCCTGGPGYVWITDDEIARLAEFLKLSVPDVLKRYCRKLSGHISLKEKVPNDKGEYDCIFLQEIPPEKEGEQPKRICTVYPVRPLQCSTWPFWDGNLSSRRAWDAAGKRCPGVNRGRKWAESDIVARRDANGWPDEGK
jgi:Fe-S-cluster containining protein